MEQITVEIGDKQYNCKVAKTPEEKSKGLQGITELPKDEGMLFIFDSPQTVGFWMKDTQIPLDIIFINEDGEVISVYKGDPENEDIAKEKDVKYVLEVNQGSGIEEGDQLDKMEESEVKMEVINPDGSTQMFLEGGERLFSRKNTVTLIKMAKRADVNKDDKYYKALGKKVFKYLDTQDSNKPEYVESPKDSQK